MMRQKINMLFQDLTLRQRFLIYIIPLLIGALIFLNTGDKTDGFSSNKTIQKSLPKIDSNLLVMQSYENLIKEFNLNMESFKFAENTVLVKINGSENDVFDFLSNVEQTSQIISIDFKFENNNLIAECEIQSGVLKFNKTSMVRISKNKSKLFNTTNQNNNKIELENNTQPELSKIKTEKKITKKTVDKNSSSQKKQNTMAIVGKYVLINGKWLTEGDTFDGYKIIDISKTSIKVEKDSKITVKEIFNEE